MLGFQIIKGTDPIQAIVYHTYIKKGEMRNRVVKVKKDNTTWKETAILLEDIPGGPIHNGGHIEIGPRRDVFITTGDAGNPKLAQDIHSLAGKILRVKIDGKIPGITHFRVHRFFPTGIEIHKDLPGHKTGRCTAQNMVQMHKTN